MTLSRRSLLIAAPAVILTPGLLMPIKPWVMPITFSAVGGKIGEYRYLWFNNSVYELVESGWVLAESKPILSATRHL